MTDTMTDLDRFLSCEPGHKTHDLTSADCAYILGINKATVERMVKAESLGSKRYQGRALKREAISIPRASLIRHLVRTSKGDATDTLMVEIAQKAPQWLAIAQRELEMRSLEPGRATHAAIQSSRPHGASRRQPMGALNNHMIQTELF